METVTSLSAMTGPYQREARVNASGAGGGVPLALT
jgi:hypothetical protein